ncbi:MAG: GNAT family N-acetyltransferase [Alphaproteobacteria bacterium]
MTGVLVVPTQDRDLLAAVYAAAFDEPYTLPAVEAMLQPPVGFALVAGARADRPPQGFAIARSVADEAELLMLGVVPAERRSGIGRALTDAVCDAAAARGAKTLFLEVGEDNPAALALYRAAGFETVGRRPGYYRRSAGLRVAALVMRRQL